MLALPHSAAPSGHRGLSDLTVKAQVQDRREEGPQVDQGRREIHQSKK
jgi:hypothetical protein